MAKGTTGIPNNYFESLKPLVKWIAFLLPVSIAIGSVVAMFLSLLTMVIHMRFAHTWLLYLLPLAGLLIHFIYQGIGKSSERGTNLILEELNNQGGGIPKRMAPIILITTLLTHLFGGSAGREGTAVQIGGGVAAIFGKWFKLNKPDMRILIIAGIAAGFGAVFGTPLTGAVFAMEVITFERIKYKALLPALLAAVIANLTVTAWHIEHARYSIDPLSATSNFNILLLSKVFIAATLFGLASYLFSKLVTGIKKVSLKLFKHTWIIPIFGGLVIIALTSILGKPDYLSLGVDAEYNGAITISSAFHHGGADTWSWLWKTFYTTITLGTGFKGGEVTPLFYIGATLGNTLSGILNAPVSLFAALGFIAVFAGATNTPLACTFMGVELFGREHVLLFGIACFTAYLFSGNVGIYSSPKVVGQKLFDRNSGDAHPPFKTTRLGGYLHQKFCKYHIIFNKPTRG